MKGLSVKELIGHDTTELRGNLRRLEGELFKHRLKHTTNQLENTMLIRKARRDIARVNTALAARLRADAQTGGQTQAPEAKE